MKEAKENQIADDCKQQDIEEYIHELEAKVRELELHMDTEHEPFLIETRSKGRGNQYSPIIRQLYYALLVERIAPKKIKGIVQSVLKCMVPSADVGSIQLPSKSCADYMRRDELPTVSRAHKADYLGSAESIALNSDGTTKHQQKKAASIMNGMVLGVHDVANGSADAALQAMRSEMEIIRTIAEELGSSTSGLTFEKVTSSTSDGAATQGKLNKLLQKEKQSGDIVEYLCSMHLGTNLRVAQVAGIQAYNEAQLEEEEAKEQEGRTYSDVDTVVNATAKLIGEHGAPEYCQGKNFRIFLKSKQKDGEYKDLAKVHLARQVGSRYYVTSYNAGRILCLSEALKEFLVQEQMLKSLNKLEKEVQQKMGQKDILAQLKLDGLLFEHLYSDLMMLVKSKALDKSVLDMNVHYLELKGFLEELTQHPHQIMNPNYQVFPSESRLYGNSPITSHRLHPGYIPVRRRLYQPDLFDTLELYPRVQQAAETMMEKLMNYKADQLPGGRYWEPTGEIREIMASLKPHNDNSESVLGMNDWLTTTFPNMHQQTRSTLIEMSTNKIIEWLAKQPSDRCNLVTDFATSKRKESQKQQHQAQQALEEEYLRQREAAVAKAKVKEGKKAREKELLQTGNDSVS